MRSGVCLLLLILSSHAQEVIQKTTQSDLVVDTALEEEPKKVATKAKPKAKAPAPSAKKKFIEYLKKYGLYVFLACIPVAIGLKVANISPVGQFAASLLGIMPLAGILGDATEELAERSNQFVAGFLNATFGNATELIIAIIGIISSLRTQMSAQDQANMDTLVRASLTGSILGNCLLVLGSAIMIGALYRKQPLKFNNKTATATAAMSIKAIGSMLVPVLVKTLNLASDTNLHYLSIGISCVLILSYIVHILSQMNLSNVSDGKEDKKGEDEEDDKKEGGGDGKYWWVKDVAMMTIATGFIGYLSEILVDSVSSVTSSLHLSQLFMGVTVIAIIGNIAEHTSAIRAAMTNKVDTAIETSVGSALQIAMFVAPLVTLVSLVRPTPMDLVYSPLEVAGMFVTMLLLGTVLQQGQANWIQGEMLISYWIVLAISFYFVNDVTVISSVGTTNSTNTTTPTTSSSTSTTSTTASTSTTAKTPSMWFAKKMDSASVFGDK